MAVGKGEYGGNVSQVRCAFGVEQSEGAAEGTAMHRFGGELEPVLYKAGCANWDRVGVFAVEFEPNGDVAAAVPPGEGGPVQMGGRAVLKQELPVAGGEGAARPDGKRYVMPRHRFSGA
jgi:hypothetical protein